MKPLGAAEQNMMTWLLELHCREDLPPCFLPDFDARLAGRPFPYTVYCPGQRDGRKDLDARLLCLDGDRVLVLSRDEAPFEARLADLSLTGILRVLLECRFLLATEQRCCTIDFNPVCKDLLYQVLRAARGLTEGAPPVLTDELERLRSTDYKAYNIARRELAGAAPLRFWLRQTMVPPRRLSFSAKPRVAAHMLLLTETELIWVTEAETESLGTATYGGDAHYVPLWALRDLTLLPEQRGLITLQARLVGERTLNIRFPAGRRGEVAQLLALV